MKILAVLFLLGCSCSPKLEKRVVLATPSTTNELTLLDSTISNGVRAVSHGIDDLNEQWAERYFEFRVCQELLQRMGVEVSVHGSNGVRPWMEIASTNTKPLRVEIPPFKAP